MEVSMNRLIILAAIILCTVTASAYGQACGGSVRSLQLEFPADVKTVPVANYNLYYVLPAGAKPEDLGDEKLSAHVSEFYYGDPKRGERYFWFGFDDRAPLLAVSAERADRFINNYKEEDHSNLFRTPESWRRHHQSQLAGAFKKGRLDLKTSETDDTPFLMRITADGYETLYFLSAFLGGCHYRPSDGSMVVQTLKMKRAISKNLLNR